jgi:TPR repeat protein
MYFYGEGTMIDKKKAAYWIEQACTNGYTEAKEFWDKNKLWKYK